eukprot:TRINITY_DN23425_c0_g1_i1.p1 TRINITY_DN23425_c0_g1~~TRINITY_DN23425_c0_g1_i1.p1  ORF type:complete len:556 (+),score=66.38 TRINITY_DN23425_c0_g1_i1:114-1781(+)
MAQVEYVDADHDHIRFTIEGGKLRKYVNGQRKVGGKVGDGIVTELHFNARSKFLSDQAGWGGVLPLIFLAPLRDLADKASVRHDLNAAVPEQAAGASAKAIQYMDNDEDHICFAVESGQLIKYVNGEKKAGGRVGSGVVTRLRFDSRTKFLSDQAGWGGVLPLIYIAPLRGLADEAGVSHDLPNISLMTRVDYVDTDGDKVAFELKGRQLVKSVNGKTKVGPTGKDPTGVVTRLSFNPRTLRVDDQHGWGGSMPAEAINSLKLLADQAGVQHNIVAIPPMQEVEYMDGDDDIIRMSIEPVGNSMKLVKYVNGVRTCGGGKDRTGVLTELKCDTRARRLDDQYGWGGQTPDLHTLRAIKALADRVGLPHNIPWVPQSGGCYMYTMYHGTSEKVSQAIAREGFRLSGSGQLGAGVYLVDDMNATKAKRFAHDEFYRMSGSLKDGDYPCDAAEYPEHAPRRLGEASSRPVLIECVVTVRKPYLAGGRCDNWHRSHDACWTPRTDCSLSSEWCVRDAGQIRIGHVHSLVNKGCPWGDHCPYEKRTSMPNTPWGGNCPCK